MRTPAKSPGTLTSVEAPGYNLEIMKRPPSDQLRLAASHLENYRIGWPETDQAYKEVAKWLRSQCDDNDLSLPERLAEFWGRLIKPEPTIESIRTMYDPEV